MWHYLDDERQLPEEEFNRIYDGLYQAALKSLAPKENQLVGLVSEAPEVARKEMACTLMLKENPETIARHQSTYTVAFFRALNKFFTPFKNK